MDLAMYAVIAVVAAVVYAICLLGGLAVLQRRALQGLRRPEQR
jgi:predicted small integral membrane protein